MRGLTVRDYAKTSRDSSPATATIAMLWFPLDLV